MVRVGRLCSTGALFPIPSILHLCKSLIAVMGYQKGQQRRCQQKTGLLLCHVRGYSQSRKRNRFYGGRLGIQTFGLRSTTRYSGKQIDYAVGMTGSVQQIYRELMWASDDD